MSRIKLLSVLILVVMTVVACESDKGLVAPALDTESATASLDKRNSGGGETAYTCNTSGEWVGFNETNDPDYSIYEYTLWAGKHNDAGTVSITNNDAGNVVVTYNTNSTADLGEVHVYVWTSADEIPTRRPSPGHAQYTAESINADSYSIELVDHAADCGSTLYISTHAALIGNDTDNDEAGSGDNAGETAYAGDASSPECFDGQKGAWWGYVNYSVECFYNIAGSVYSDDDNSADREEDESGFGGITVILTDADGNIVASTTTNSDGSYLFEHVAGGADYTVISGTPEGDYLANENAGGYPISGLNSDTEGVDFGFVPLWDIALSVSVFADCDFDLEVSFDGVAVAGQDGFYFIENQLPGVSYTLTATATSSEGAVSQSWTGDLTADLSLDFELQVQCPVVEYDPCDTNMDGVVDAAEQAACNPAPPVGDNFPLWGQDISHVVLVFSSSSAPNGDPIDDGFYLIKVDNYQDDDPDDLDDDIDSYLAALVAEGYLTSSFDLLGSSIKGGRQVTGFYAYGSYNTNGTAADSPLSDFPLTYDGSSANEGNQNQIDVVVDRADLLN